MIGLKDEIAELDRIKSKYTKRIDAYDKINDELNAAYQPSEVGKCKKIVLNAINKTLNNAKHNEEIQIAMKVAGHLMTYDTVLKKEELEDIITKIKQMIEGSLHTKTSKVEFDRLIGNLSLYVLFFETQNELHHNVIPYLQNLLFKAQMDNSVSKTMLTILLTSIVQLIASFSTLSYKITWFERLAGKFLDFCNDDDHRINSEFKFMVAAFFTLSYEALAESLNENKIVWDDIVKDDWKDYVIFSKLDESIQQFMKTCREQISHDDRIYDRFDSLFIHFFYYRRPSDNNSPDPESIIIVDEHELFFSTVRQRLIYDLVFQVLGSVYHLYCGSTKFCNMVEFVDPELDN
mmetsp:Transcript_13759/g.20848  ORF Transcript_13759/g.20848 Transcript_13759/m.20848 type:complete len:348 (-) Transcript_13759:268-1311(-)